jgi:hypothetical protein
VGEARVDVPIGCIPDYRTFVRHVWSYKDSEHGRCISSPPWVYRCIFDKDEAAVAQGNARAVIAHAAGGRIEVVELSLSRREVRFADLKALHTYLVSLAGVASEDRVARTIGEFLMWTLGFRWV